MAFFALAVSKYLVLWIFPSSSPEIQASTMTREKNSTTVETGMPSSIELTIDYKVLKPKVEEEYAKAQTDIDDYIDVSIQKQQQRAYYNLAKDDGFLDWIFGYFTGWKMMWKKIKGVFGSDDNEIKMVSDKFQHDVMKPGYDQTMHNIQTYTKNRTEDYYKTVITLTSEYLRDQTLALKEQGFNTVEIDVKQIPWNKYIVSSAADGFALLELSGVTSISVFVGKLVGGKVAALLGPKVLGLITVKTASVVAGKIAASFSLIFAPIVDIVINEGAKQLQYNTSKKEFETMIDIIFKEVQSDIGRHAGTTLQQVKNDIYAELNKHTTIKAVK